MPEKLTRKEVETACDNLKQALIDYIELDEKSEKISLLKAKAQKNLSMCRDEVRALRI
jgi:hypothetical protein